MNVGQLILECGFAKRIAEHVAEARDALGLPLSKTARGKRAIERLTTLGLKVSDDPSSLMLLPALREEEQEGRAGGVLCRLHVGCMRAR